MENNLELDEETIKIIDEKISPYLERLKLLEESQIIKDKEIIILKHAVNDVFLKIENSKNKLKKLPKSFLKRSLYQSYSFTQ